jgi:ubiquinone/menaquinone biosynthesis C-methylase UbiE
MIGVDMVEPLPEALEAGVEYITGDLSTTGIPDATADVIISRSVLEHLEDPDTVFAEFARILKPGGTFIALTPNIGDYVSIISMMIPNRLHPWIVEMTEGRAPEDTFPTFYRANSRRAFKRLTTAHGLELEHFEYKGQYPAAFLFNPVLFLLATGYEKIISRFGFLGFLRGWVFAVMSKPV